MRMHSRCTVVPLPGYLENLRKMNSSLFSFDDQEFKFYFVRILCTPVVARFTFIYKTNDSLSCPFEFPYHMLVSTNVSQLNYFLVLKFNQFYSWVNFPLLFVNQFSETVEIQIKYLTFNFLSLFFVISTREFSLSSLFLIQETS